MKALTLLFTLFAITTGLSGQPDDPYHGSAEFERMKSLAGTWKGTGVLGPEAFDPVPFLDLLTESIGIVLNTIAATMRTEELLKQSQAYRAILATQSARKAQSVRPARRARWLAGRVRGLAG